VVKKEERVQPAPGHQKASAVISAALGTVDYPIEKAEMTKRIGHWEVPIDREKKVPLSKILDRIPHDRFDDLSRAQNEIDHHWRAVVQDLRG
jgi:hypothetical protein